MPGGSRNLASKPRVVWFNIDGLNAAPLYEALDAGELPNLGKIFNGGLRVERGVSVFPTVTVPCQASLATGCFPSRHALIGNMWFDRFSKTPKMRDYMEAAPGLLLYGRKYFKAPSVVLPPRAGASPVNTDLSGGAHTVYEDVAMHNGRSAVVFNQISRGARDWIRPGRLEIAQFALCHEGRFEFSHFERTAAKRTVSHINHVRKMPRLFMIYFPGLDGHTHRHGPKSQAGYLRTVLDPLIGMVLDALSDRRTITDYTFVLTSDHGHAEISPTPSRQVKPEDVAAILREQGRTPYTAAQGKGLRSYDTVVMPQGGSMHIAVKNKRSGHWHDFPDLRRDLFPLAVALIDASATERLNLDPGWIDIALVKDHETKRFLVVRGHKVYESEKFFATEQHAQKYPDGARRVRGLLGRNSPDIVLLADYDAGFSFSSGRPRQGMHGNLCASDSLVPIIFCGPGIPDATLPRASIVDVAPTLCSMFGGTMRTAQGTAIDVYARKLPQTEW